MADLNAHEHEHVAAQRMPLAGVRSRKTLRPRTFLIALLSGLCLLGLTSVSGHADPPLATNCSPNVFARGGAGTQGALGAVWMYARADGAVCGYGVVGDAARDGRCAHMALRWKHVNGRYYYDTGLWTCGYDTMSEKAWGWRNPTRYRSVDILVWRDGFARSERRVFTFR